MTTSQLSDLSSEIFSKEFARDPYSYYRRLRDEAPILYHADTDSWLLSRYDDVERTFKDPAFSTRNYDWQAEPLHGRILLQMDGREHTTKRSLISPGLRSPQVLESIAPQIETIARELIDAWSDEPVVDLVAGFTADLPINVIVGILGLSESERPRFQAWYRAILDFPAARHMVNPARVSEGLTGRRAQLVATGLRVKAEVSQYLMPIIEERRAEPGEDLLSKLCVAEIDGERLSDEEIKSLVSLLLAAGGETTDKALASLLKQLMLHRDQLEEVRADRSLIFNALAETLRLTPPLHWVMRETVSEVQIHGEDLPVGTTVTCLIASANRDERHYDHPDEFDIHRPDLDFNRAFVAAANHFGFGAGRHFCIGAMLAKTEVEICMNLLLDAVPNMVLEPESGIEKGVFTRGPVDLRVRR